MRHTLKWSFFIGTAVAGAVLASLRIFQPIRYEHLALFGYAFVGSSVIAGYVAHKSLEKRNRIITNQNIAMADGGNSATGGATNFSAVVKRMSVDNIETKEENGGESENKSGCAVPGFVPASELAQKIPFVLQEEKTENIVEDKQADNMRQTIHEKAATEDHPAGNLNGSEKSVPLHRADDAQKCCKGKQAKVLTKDGRIFCGRLARLDTHVFLEDASCGAEKKSMVMISKEQVERMEVE